MKNGTLAQATGCINVTEKGEKGAIERPRKWEDIPSGDSLQCGADGEMYIDIVFYNDSWYQCIKSHTKGNGVVPTNTIYYKSISDYQRLATNIFLAHKAFINNLQVGDVLIEKNGQKLLVANEDGIECNQGTFKNVNVTGKVDATSGSIGNLKITDQLYSNSSGKGSVKITPTSVQINGAGDDWANGSTISFNASGISSFAEFYGISPNPTVVIGNGFINGYGGGPTLKLDAHFASSPSLILGGFIHGFSRGTCYFDDTGPIITKGERITGDMKNSNGEYLGSCFVYGGAGDKTIYLEGSETYAGDEIIIANESSRALTIKIKSNYVSSSMNVMWVNGNSGKVSEYALRAGGVIHGIYTGNYWHLW